MKIRIVSSREEIFTLNPNEHIVHLAFRPSNKDIFGLVETCPKIEILQLPKSYMDTVSKSIKMFLEMQKIQLLEGSLWGHSYDVPSSVIDKIKAMRNEGKSIKAVEEEVLKESKLDPGIVAYILIKEALPKFE
jgi:hypothetical protein